MEGSQRRLAAILAADMVGFSRLIGVDEERTLSRQKAIRGELVDPTVQEHHGRIVKSTGDGFLAEFGSAVDAVRCALRIQSAIRDGEVAAAAGEPTIVYRMGINVGDIVIDGDDIFGDGVNIAARLESLADPGGICVSRGAFDHVKGKVDVAFEDLGARALKNIAEPIQVLRLQIDSQASPDEPARAPRSQKPSIAVLPIVNISGSVDLEPFAAGLSEDLVAALAKIPELSVAAQNATEVFRGKAVEVRHVARQLGVGNILEGKVQGSARRLRTTIQLIDGATGNYLWAGRYDTGAEDILTLQDDIIRKVLIEVRAMLTFGNHPRIDSGGTKNLDAWLLCGQAFDEWYKFTREGNFRALELFQAAHDADPRWPRPLGGLSAALREAAIRGWSRSSDQDLRQAQGFAERAIELGPGDPIGYVNLGYCRITAGEIEKGLALFERALEIAPNDVFTLAHTAWNLARAGQALRGLTLYARVLKLRPTPPSTMMANMGFVRHLAGQHEQAIDALKDCLARSTQSDAHIRLAAIYVELGRLEEGRAEIAHVLAGEPDANIREYTENLPFPNQSKNAWYVGLLRAAGLPDD